MMVLDNKYEIGDIVYLITDPEQDKRIITAIECYKNGEILYKLTLSTSTSYHYDFEISVEADNAIKVK